MSFVFVVLGWVCVVRIVESKRRVLLSGIPSCRILFCAKLLIQCLLVKDFWVECLKGACGCMKCYFLSNFIHLSNSQILYSS